MGDSMEIDDAMAGSTTHLLASSSIPPSDASNMQRECIFCLFSGFSIRISTAPAAPRDNFRDIQVKVHIRRPERDQWSYMGRGLVSHEVVGQSSRVGAFSRIFLGIQMD